VNNQFISLHLHIGCPLKLRNNTSRELVQCHTFSSLRLELCS
jgi:hypothetical protein